MRVGVPAKVALVAGGLIAIVAPVSSSLRQAIGADASMATVKTGMSWRMTSFAVEVTVRSSRFPYASVVVAGKCNAGEDTGMEADGQRAGLAGGTWVADGGRDLHWIDVATLSSGMPLRIAVHELRGTRSGPTLGICAAIHGDELAPVEALRRLLGSLDRAELSGRLMVAPLVNPLAFQSQTRHTPQDMQNLNRLFPGDPDGWLSEQLAATFSSAFLPGLDALLDLHAGGALPTVDYAYIDNDPALSAALGTKVLYRGPGYAGTFSHIAVSRGIPCVVTELGGGLLRDDAYIEFTVAGITSVMRHLGMLPGDPIRRPDQITVDELRILRPHHGGLLVPAVGVDRLGDVLPGGTLLGTVYHAQTFEELEAFHAPFARTLLILARGAVTRVEAGDYAYMIASE
jgi:hypothetical protein